MADDPIDAVYSFVERAYVRLQAGDLLMRCLEEHSLAPMHQIVEGFVLAGPQSLDALREILAEAAQRRSQLLDDLNQVYNEMEGNLKSYGIGLEKVKNPQAILGLTPVRFLAILRRQGVREEEKQIACLQILRDSKELVAALDEHLSLIQEVENYLQDWLWGLAYQSARQNRNERSSPSSNLSI